MAYQFYYDDITVKGITYTGKGADGNQAVSSWSIDPATTNYYNWYTNGSPTGTVSDVSASAYTLYLQSYVADGGTLATDPYRVGWYAGAAFGYVREDAFPTGTNTIKYNANGGSSTPANGTLTYNVGGTAAAAISRTGYSFYRWNTKADGSGTNVTAGGTIPSSLYTSYAWNGTKPTLTLYATWTPNTYTITYNANGGGTAPASQTKTYGVDLTLQSSCGTYTGRTLTGWNTKADGTGTAYGLGDTYSANAAATLYAQWRLNTYTVTYNANGGSGTVSNQTKTYGVNLTLASSGYTKTGYTLTKWNTKADGTGTDYALGATYSSNAALTLYAVWSINTWPVTYNANGGGTAPASQTKTYNVNLTLQSSCGTRTGYSLSKWNTAANGTGTSYAKGATYTANAALNLYAVWVPDAPTAPTGVTNTRNSDTKNTVSWTNPSGKVISSTTILRSVDGGSFATLTTITGSTTSYADTTTAANHSYAYKVKVTNASGSATSSATSTTYNTPAAPTAVSAARDANNDVVLTITNPAITATGADIQRSTDGSTWTTVSSPSGTPVTSATDTPGGGTFYYRVRNTRSSLTSAWSPASNAVVTLVAPNAPTLVSPASGAVISTATANITFQWTHNPVDGSAQTAAQVRYSTDGGSNWTTTTISSAANTKSITNSFSDNATVTWQARTKGAASSYGAWSGSRTFKVCQQPGVTFTSPANGATITTMPIAVALSYTDGVSTLANAIIKVYEGGQERYRENIGSSTSCNISTNEFLPENGHSYTLRADVTSTSSLTAYGTSDITIAFAEPDYADLAITNDPLSGTVTLQPTIVPNSGQTTADSISIYRVVDGHETLIASGLADGAAVIDYYAPCNKPYAYRVATFATSGAAASVDFDNTLRTNRVFCMWDGGASFAYAIYNPTGSISLTRPTKTRVQYAGRTYPVSYDGVAQDDQRQVTCTLATLDERDRFLALIDAGGRAVYKSFDGDVFYADINVRFTPAWQKRIYGTVTLSIIRIESGAL